MAYMYMVPLIGSTVSIQVKCYIYFKSLVVVVAVVVLLTSLLFREAAMPAPISQITNTVRTKPYYKTHTHKQTTKIL